MAPVRKKNWGLVIQRYIVTAASSSQKAAEIPQPESLKGKADKSGGVRS